MTILALKLLKEIKMKGKEIITWVIGEALNAGGHKVVTSLMPCIVLNRKQLRGLHSGRNWGFESLSPLLFIMVCSD